MVITVEQSKRIVDYMNRLLKKHGTDTRVSKLIVQSSKWDFAPESSIIIFFNSNLSGTKPDIPTDSGVFSELKGLKPEFYEDGYVSFEMDAGYTEGWLGAGLQYYQRGFGYHLTLIWETIRNHMLCHAIGSVEEVPAFMAMVEGNGSSES